MKRKCAIIFLHGSGGDGRDLKAFFESVPIPSLDFLTFREAAMQREMEIITPTARLRPYSASGGSSMRVWFDRSPLFMARGIDDTFEDVRGTDSSIELVMIFYILASISNNNF